MRYRRAIMLVIGVGFLCIGGLLWKLNRDSPATYKGRSLDYWLKHDDDRELREAVQAIGTNALPRLLELLQADTDSLPDRVLEYAFETGIEWNVQITLPIESAYTKWGKAHKGFAALGVIALPAVPGLSNQLVRGESPIPVAGALYAIGPGGFPALTAASVSPDKYVRYAVAGAAWDENLQNPLQNPELIRVLAKLMQDFEPLVRLGAAGSLGAATSYPELALPALYSGLSDTSAAVRWRSAESIGGFGAVAADAVPKLVELSQDPKGNVSAAAAKALRQIQTAMEEK
jgi:hypothetical protein